MNFPWYSTNVGSGSLLFRYESGHLNQAFTWNLNPSNLFHFPVLDIYWNMSSHLLENKVHSWQKPTNIWLFIIKGFKKNSLIWVVNVFPYWFYWINCGFGLSYASDSFFSLRSWYWHRWTLTGQNNNSLPLKSTTTSKEKQQTGPKSVFTIFTTVTSEASVCRSGCIKHRLTKRKLCSCC